MQPAAVPLTELLQRLVVILTALLEALGLALAEDLVAELLKLGEQREPQGAVWPSAAAADSPGGAGESVRKKVWTAPPPVAPADGKLRGTREAAPESGEADGDAGRCGDTAPAAVTTKVNRRCWPSIDMPAGFRTISLDGGRRWQKRGSGRKIAVPAGLTCGHFVAISKL